MSTTILTRRRSVPAPSLRLLALPALTAALVVNTILHLVGEALGAFATIVAVPPAGGRMTLSAVLTLTLLGVTVGLSAAAATAHLTRRPALVFRRLVLGGLLLSLGGPMLIPDAPIGLILTLVLMHLVVAVAVLAAGLTALRD